MNPGASEIIVAPIQIADLCGPAGDTSIGARNWGGTAAESVAATGLHGAHAGGRVRDWLVAGTASNVWGL